MIASVWQMTSKPTDVEKPLRIVWTVKLHTHPHIADIEVSSDALIYGSLEFEKFVAWAKSLNCTDKIQIDL